MRLGKDKQAIILAVSLVFSASASGQTGKSYKFHLDGNLPKSEVIVGNQSVIINYSISDVTIESISNNSGSYYRISIPDHIRSVVPGKPELPVFSRLISIPEGSGYKIKISEVKSVRINPSGKKIEGLLIPARKVKQKNFNKLDLNSKLIKELMLRVVLLLVTLSVSSPWVS